MWSVELGKALSFQFPSGSPVTLSATSLHFIFSNQGPRLVFRAHSAEGAGSTVTKEPEKPAI